MPDPAERRLPAIVQARLSSTRLPGKMLRKVNGKPLLEYVVDRLRHCPTISEIVIATSVDSLDDGIVEFCRERKLAFGRGSGDNVADRFRQVVEASGFECFARICGDRPLLDSQLLARGMALYGNAIDVVTNVQPRTFPPGQTVEIVRASALIDACSRMSEPQDCEHVTRYFYTHPADYRIVNFAADDDFAGVHLAIDTEADLKRFEGIVARMTRPHWSYALSDVVSLYREVA